MIVLTLSSKYLGTYLRTYNNFTFLLRYHLHGETNLESERVINKALSCRNEAHSHQNLKNDVNLPRPPFFVGVAPKMSENEPTLTHTRMQESPTIMTGSWPPVMDLPAPPFEMPFKCHLRAVINFQQASLRTTRLYRSTTGETIINHHHHTGWIVIASVLPTNQRLKVAQSPTPVNTTTRNL